MVSESINPEVLAAADRILRERNHPHFAYVPGPTTKAALHDLTRHILLDGGNGSGKTYAMGQVIAYCMRGEHPVRTIRQGAKFALFCISRNQGHNVWRELLLGEGARPGVDGTTTDDRGLLPSWLIARNQKKNMVIAWDTTAGRPVPKKITMANGNTLDFYWHGNKHQWEQLQGTEYDGVFIDEAGDDTTLLLAEIEARFRKSLSKDINAGFVFWAATDTTANEDFEAWKEKGKDPNNSHFAYYHIEPGENPIMTKEVREAIAAGMTEDEAAIRVHGTRSRADDLRILQLFDESVHVMETDYIPSDRDNVVAVYDPGLLDDSAFLIAHLNPSFPRRAYITKFLTQKNSTVKDDGDMLIRGLGPFKMRMLIYDKNGAGRRDKNSRGKTTIQQLMEYLIDKDIWQNGAACQPPAGQIHDQVQALNGKLSRLCDDGLPEFMISRPFDAMEVDGDGNGLRKFVRELTNWRLKVHSMGQELRTGNIHQKNNEGPDTARYLAMVSPGWIDLGPNGSQYMGTCAPADPELVRKERMERRKTARDAFLKKARRGRVNFNDLKARFTY